MNKNSFFFLIIQAVVVCVFSNLSLCEDPFVLFEYASDKSTYVFSKPLSAHVVEWRASKIPEDLIALNLISVPDRVELQKDKVRYPILDLLGWKYHDKFPISPNRVAWSYHAYNVSDLQATKDYELKILPHYPLEGSGYLRYYRSNDDVRIWLPKVSIRVSKKIFPFDIRRDIYNYLYISLDRQESTVLEDTHFWKKVIYSSHPIVFTEGMKKSLSILGAGILSVSIPGACRAFRYDKEKNQIVLIDDMQKLIANKRKVYLHFDHDSRDYIRNVVYSALLLTAELIEKNGNEVRIVQHGRETKGADDYIAAHGAESYHKLLTESLNVEQFKNSGFKFMKKEELLNVGWCFVECEARCIYEKDFMLRNSQ